MRRWTPFLSLIMLVVFTATALACPNCKESIAISGEGTQQAGLPSGFNYSIYYMLAGVFSMAGVVIGVIFKGVRSADAAMQRRLSQIPKSQP